jgi:RNA polymerase sigma-70 factor (ECF subfamily)
MGRGGTVADVAGDDGTDEELEPQESEAAQRIATEARDRVRFEEEALALADQVYRVARHLSNSREEAEDLVQETYARVLARPRMLRNEDDLGYLLSSLRNTFLNQKRTERRRLRSDPLPDEMDLVADPRAQDPTTALEATELYAAIAALPESYRDVLVAVDITGLSYKEAARALRIREGTVMSRLYRARQQVVRRLEGETHDAD